MRFHCSVLWVTMESSELHRTRRSLTHNYCSAHARVIKDGMWQSMVVSFMLALTVPVLSIAAHRSCMMELTILLSYVILAVIIRELG